MQSMQNTTFLALLRPIFALKAKIATLISIENDYFNFGLEENLVTKIDPDLGEDLLFLFWSSPDFVLKNVPILSEDRFSLVFTSETPPPYFKLLAKRQTASNKSKFTGSCKKKKSEYMHIILLSITVIITYVFVSSRRRTNQRL